MELKEVNKGYRRAYRELAEAGELLKYWYYYVSPVYKDIICDLCGQESKGHHLIEITGLNLEEFDDWLDLAGYFVDKFVCSFCLEKVRIYQRDFEGRKFWEDWDSGEGVEIVCLYCGWRGFVYASWNSLGGEEVVESWVSNKESEHRRVCDY